MQTSLGQLGATPEMHSTQTPAAVTTTPVSSQVVCAVATLTSITLGMSLTGELPPETLPLQALSRVTQSLERASEGVRALDPVILKISLPPRGSPTKLKACIAAAWEQRQRGPCLKVCPDHQAIYLLVSSQDVPIPGKAACTASPAFLAQSIHHDNIMCRQH